MIFTNELDPNSATTQISSTVKSYRKVAEFLVDILDEGNTVLDYGAGKGLGTFELKSILEPKGILVFSYEPFPASNLPDFKNPEEIPLISKFDAIVNLNVLNVVQLSIRNKIVEHILHLLKPEGIAIFGTRAWRGDISNTKHYELGPEPKSIYVIKQKEGNNLRVLQKGFDGVELTKYLQSFTTRQVTNLGGQFAATTALINPELKE